MAPQDVPHSSRMTTRALFPAVLPHSQECKSNQRPVVIDVSAQHTWKDDSASLQLTVKHPHGCGDTMVSATASAPCPESAEAKRARRSAIEKMSRQKRKEALAGMRHEVRHLEQRVAALTMTTTRRERRRGSDKRPLAVVPLHQLQQQYSQLVLVTRALEHNRAALCKLLQERVAATRRAAAAATKEPERRLWVSGVPLCSPSFAVRFRQLSFDECFRIVCSANHEIETFCAANSVETTGVTFMGWTDKRKLDRDLQMFQYCFTKRFSLEMPERLLARSWQVYSIGDKMR
uniref:BZIP domain-containing protein n=1 Tax=Hyaloperonospora arabidopsidis (strain Emoy2) TaxID=559515 RepID=M4BLQ8_HYAAE